jgi:hypothetical protein
MPSGTIFYIVSHVALESAMACRVFRSLRLGLISETDGTTPQFYTQQPRFPVVLASSPDGSVSGVLQTIQYLTYFPLERHAVVGKRFLSKYILGLNGIFTRGSTGFSSLRHISNNDSRESDYHPMACLCIYLHSKSRVSWTEAQ